MMKMRTLLIGLVFLNFASQVPAGGEDSPDLKKLKLFPDKYEGKTIVLKNIQYLHKIERQYDQFTFHVSSQGTFIFMLKEAANEGSLAMITSPALAEKLADADLKGLPRGGQGWYPLTLTCKVEKIQVGTRPVWVARVSQFDFLDTAGKVAKTIQ